MKISELVAELEVLWALHGDVDVLREDFDRIGDRFYVDVAPRFDGADVVL